MERALSMRWVITFLLIFILSQVCLAMVDETMVVPGGMEEPVVVNSDQNKKIILPPGLSGYKVVKEGGNIPEGLNISSDSNSIVVINNGNNKPEDNLPPELQNALQGNNVGNNSSSDPNQNSTIQQISHNNPDNGQNVKQDNTGKILVFMLVTLIILLAILLIYLFNRNKVSTN
jgi:hypothetical protein